MYVRKFEADTLEEALKNIKMELGPDAIILKTVTNKGIKGAFKKKKYEITAAISEKNIGKKMQVDRVLNEEQKEQFYSAPSSHISKMIHKEEKPQARSQTPQGGGAGYGNLGLNRAVKMIPKDEEGMSTSQTMKKPARQTSGLDDFLNAPQPQVEEDYFEEREAPQPRNVKQFAPPQVNNVRPIPAAPQERVEDEEMQKRVDDLELKLYELSKSFERMDQREAQGIYSLRVSLRSLNINEKYVQSILRKALFDLKREEQENADTVLDYALKDMINAIKVEPSMFAMPEFSGRPVITVLLSEAAAGQSSMLLKLGALKRDSVLIKNEQNSNENQEESFTEKLFGMNVQRVKGIPSIVAETRKAIEQNKSVFIDFRANPGELNETKKFIDGLRRSFDYVEVLISLSAIHSELYNKLVQGRYRTLAQGIVLSHLDLCLDFGSLFNLVEDAKGLPYKYFGTGSVVPNDIEEASAERVLAGIFQFE